MGLLDRGSAMLARLVLSEGVPVAYTRGGVPAALVALAAKQMSEVESGDAGRFRKDLRGRLYTFAAAELRAAGLFPPAAGDRITEAFADGPKTFEVAKSAATPGLTEWEWSDAPRLTLTVTCRPV